MIDAFRTAIALFRSSTTRFLLTVSGIVVGVASLVLLASLLEVGKQLLVDSSSRAVGADVVTVSNDWRRRDRWPDERMLDRHDQSLIESSALLDDLAVGANYGMADRQVTRGVDELDPFVVGVTEHSMAVYRLKVSDGRPFGPTDFSSLHRVALVGAKVFDGLDPVKPGQVLRVEGVPYTVVGILKEKPDMGPGGHWGWNNRVLLPANAFNLDFNASRRPSAVVSRVDAVVDDLEIRVQSAREVVGALLMSRREHQNFRFEGAASDSTEEVVVQVIEALVLLTTFFSMVVGGINIMNIMLVTVTERTREIGLRRAIGATRGDIRRQFIAETVAVTLVGAVLGVALALLGLALGTAALDRWVTEWPFHVAPWSVALAVSFSAAIGLVFGIAPASHAASLDPVDALRSDG